MENTEEKIIPKIPEEILSKYDVGWNYSPRGVAHKRNKWQISLFNRKYPGRHSFAEIKENAATPIEALEKAIQKLNFKP